MIGALKVLVKELRELWDWPRPAIWVVICAILLLVIVGNLRLNEPVLRVLFVSNGSESAKTARMVLAEIANIELIEVIEPGNSGRERMMSETGADIGVFWDDGWMIYERDQRSNKAGLIHATASEIAASLQEQRPWQVSVAEHWLNSGKRRVLLIGSGISAGSQGTSLIPAYIAFVILFVPFVIASGSIVREEELGTLQTLLIAPGVSWRSFFLGKVAAPVIFSFMLLNLLVIVSYAWFDLVLSGAWLRVLGVQLLAILSSTLLGFVAGTAIRSQQQANLAAAGYFLLLLLATGFLEPIEQAARPIQLLSGIFPLTWSYGFLADGMLSDADPARALNLSYRLLAQIAGFSALAVLGVIGARRRI
jgi:hypothetical protein